MTAKYNPNVMASSELQQTTTNAMNISSPPLTPNL
jgi:hypothetical protein